jgi:hypothetical protein
MKKLQYIAIIATVVLSAVSCADVLDISPVENNTADQFYKTDIQMRQAMMGIYARLGRNGSNDDFPSLFHLQLSENRSDNWWLATMPNAAREQADVRRFLVSDVTALNATAFNRLYTMIADINTLLKFADEATYKRYHAEARFLRAYAYFELVRAWGPQPVLTTPLEKQDALSSVRQPETEVYTQIVQDLQYAAANLEPVYSSEESGRVGSYAANTLLAYVYVTMAGYPVNDATAYQKAADVLSPFINGLGSRFAPEYADIFDVNKENMYDLFSVQFASGNKGLGSSVPGYQVGGGGSTETIFPEWVYSSYTVQGQDMRIDSMLVKQMLAAKDDRAKFPILTKGYWNTKTHGTTAGDSAEYWVSKPYLLIKYLVRDNTNSVIKTWNDYPLNFPILRVADAYLLYAEALVGTNKAADAKKWVDEVRVRAGLEPLAANPTPDDVMDERRREFLGEGKRYFDLVRQGKDKFINTLKPFCDYYGNRTEMNGVDPAARDMLLPIPLTVMNIHLNWTQNPDY